MVRMKHRGVASSTIQQLLVQRRGHNGEADTAHTG